MPTLTRPRRYVLATLALVVLTIAPTVYVAWWAWSIHQPEHLRASEAELSRQLGLQVHLERVSYPRPGEVLYQGMVLKHLEPRSQTFAEVARVRSLRAYLGHRELRLQADDLKLRGDGPRQAVERFASLFGRVGTFPWDRLSLLASTCVVEFGTGTTALGYTLRDLAGTYQSDRGAPTVSASYRVIEGSGETRCELTFTRDRQGPLVRNLVKLESKEGSPMPARVLDPLFHSTEWLGDRARVWGRLALTQREGTDWEAEFQGRLTDVDLSVLVGRRFTDHRLLGWAEIDVRQARWGDRGTQGFGWVEAEGDLKAGPGSISRSLVDALGRQLSFRQPTPIAPLGPDLPFLALGLSFSMTRDGQWRFGGPLDGEWPRDAVLVDARRGTLLLAPRDPADSRGVVKALFPVASETPDLLVPATSESQSVQRFLPLPSSLAVRPAGLDAE